MSEEFLKSIHFFVGGVEIEVDMSRLNANFKKAQFWLDSQIMTDMIPFMPMITGNFIQRTKTISDSWAGTGKVCAGAEPMGRYLYYGKRMVDSATGRGPFRIENAPGEFIFRFRKGTILSPTSTPLKYTTTFNPAAGPKWFEAAKKAHGAQWVNGVNQIMGEE